LHVLAVVAVLLLGAAATAATVSDVYNAPNPLVTQTTFYLVYYPTPHNFHSVVVKVYNLAGVQVAQPSAANSDHVHWPGTGFGGSYLANGTYIYRVYVYEEEYGQDKLIWQSGNTTLQIAK